MQNIVNLNKLLFTERVKFSLKLSKVSIVKEKQKHTVHQFSPFRVALSESSWDSHPRFHRQGLNLVPD